MQVPFGPPGDTEDIAYRITFGSLHHPSSAVPFTVLTWVDTTHP
ncbi:hypothetical protein ACIBO2_20715 [Nonomuraea sp. NPDC050022]